MPFIMIMMAMLATLFFGADGRQDRRADEVKATAQATASRMAWYHGQAMRQCAVAGSCPTGEVTVDQSSLNTPLNLATTFQTASNGTILVTTWRGTPTETDARTMRGLVGAALSAVTEGSLNAGLYSAPTSSIRSSTAVVYAEAGSAQVGRSITVPATVGPMTVQDGSPVIASQLN